jgi:hypothetical protein
VHASDGTLSTDGGVNCLDWTVEGDEDAYMSKCDPAGFPHQNWSFTSDGHLTTPETSDVLDWTSKESPDAGHRVYMHARSSSLPHQACTHARAHARAMQRLTRLCVRFRSGTSARG